MIGWDAAEARYDAWRTAAPSEPRYGWEEFATYVDDNPDCGWDPDNEDDLTAFIDMMEQENREAAIDAAEANRYDDDAAYWASL